jgi:AraC-like DNA-binding protein
MIAEVLLARRLTLKAIADRYGKSRRYLKRLIARHRKVDPNSR